MLDHNVTDRVHSEEFRARDEA
jgi:hypothetical protein